MKAVGDAARGGFEGYMTGRMIGQGVGVAHRAATNIPAYRRAAEASVVGQYYGTQMPRRAPGPRSVGYYQYEYNMPQLPGERTSQQRALLAEQRAVSTHLNNLTQAPRSAAYHNENPVAQSHPNTYPGHEGETWSQRRKSWYQRQVSEARRQGVAQPGRSVRNIG